MLCWERNRPREATVSARLSPREFHLPIEFPGRHTATWAMTPDTRALGAVGLTADRQSKLRSRGPDNRGWARDRRSPDRDRRGRRCHRESFAGIASPFSTTELGERAGMARCVIGGQATLLGEPAGLPLDRRSGSSGSPARRVARHCTCRRCVRSQRLPIVLFDRTGSVPPDAATSVAPSRIARACRRRLVTPSSRLARPFSGSQPVSGNPPGFAARLPPTGTRCSSSLQVVILAPRA